MDFEKHTFKYKEKRYAVKDLIEYLEYINIPSTRIEIPVDVLKNTDVSSSWKTLHIKDGEVVKEETVNLYNIVGHIKRILAAEYDRYPIIMHNDKILDGLHRTVHALYDGQTEIDAYVLNDAQMEEFFDFNIERYTKIANEAFIKTSCQIPSLKIRR
jgi:hypothetical protein